MGNLTEYVQEIIKCSYSSIRLPLDAGCLTSIFTYLWLYLWIMSHYKKSVWTSRKEILKFKLILHLEQGFFNGILKSWVSCREFSNMGKCKPCVCACMLMCTHTVFGRRGPELWTGFSERSMIPREKATRHSSWVSFRKFHQPPWFVSKSCISNIPGTKPTRYPNSLPPLLPLLHPSQHLLIWILRTWLDTKFH